MARHVYRVQVELEGAGSRYVEVLELEARSAWDVVAGVGLHLAHAAWCAAEAFRVVAVEGPGADELPSIVGWSTLALYRA